MSGSSPLTRGTLLRAWNHGQTMSVHPRLRGELFMNSCVPFTDARFIPAYAGNSSRLIMSTSSESVHPRLRGELFRPCESVANVVGSSPLTRGTLPNMIGNSPCPRFIPAYAGNSLALRMMSKSETVHPRLRGELMRSYLINSTDAGSSPLTRGTRRALC